MIHDNKEKYSSSVSEPIKLYFKQLNKIPAISAKEEEYLWKRIKQKDENAKKRMVEANLGLVVAIASKYRNTGLSLLDMIEEGNLGLIKAISKYEYKRGTKFSTYAVWWIRQYIRRSIDNHSKTIRIPSYAVENIRKWIQYLEKNQHDLEKLSSLKEIAKGLKLSVKEVRNTIHAAEVSKGESSLDVLINDDETATVSDLIVDTDMSTTPEYFLENLNKQEDVVAALEILNDREKKVVSDRFGLDGGQGKTLADIGREIGVTRERARQILEIALDKLRSYCKINHIEA